MMHTIHPMRRSRCFVFDKLYMNCQIPTRQNQSVQLRLICIYVYPTQAHRAFGIGIDMAKL